MRRRAAAALARLVWSKPDPTLLARVLVLVAALGGASCPSVVLYPGVLGGAAETSPIGAEAHVARAAAHLEGGRTDQALAEFDAAIRLDPTLAVAYFGRGQAHGKRGDLASAIADYDSAIGLRSDLVAAYLLKGFACQSSGRFPEALEAFRHFLAAGPPPQLAGHTDAVKKQIELLTSPRTCAMYVVRGFGHMSKEKPDLDAAIAEYDAGLALTPGCAQLYGYRAVAHHNKGEWALAIADYDRAIARNPRDVGSIHGRAIAYDKAGRGEEAIEAYRDFIAKAAPQQKDDVERARRRIRELGGG